jgi:hypothetical protein
MPWLVTDWAVAPPIFALAFLWLALALGRRLLLWLRASRDGSPGERGVVAAALGMGVLQFVPFALGAAGALGTTSLRVALPALALLTAKDLRAVAARALGRARDHRPERWLMGWMAALAPALLAALLLALLPTTDPDGLGYHLTVPKRWLESGTLAYLPTYPYSNAPMGVQMLFSLALSFAGDAGAKCLHFTCGVLGAAGLYFGGKRLRGGVAGAAAATIFLVVGPAAMVGLLGRAYTEGAIALALIAASLAWLIWFQGGERGWLRCAALLAGIAVTFKVTAALFPLALLAVTLAAPRTRGDRAGGTPPAKREAEPIWHLLPFLAAPVIPWAIRSALVTGNPFFPLFAQWIPSRDFSPATAAAFERYNRYLLWAGSLGEGWTLERRRMILIGVGVAVGLGGALLFARLRPGMARATALIVTLTVLLQMSAVGLYIRYWTPSIAVLTLPLVALLGPALSRRGAPGALLACTLIASTFQARRALAEFGYDFGGLVRAAAGGARDRRAFLLQHLDLFPIYERANRELASDAAVLLYYYCGGFYLDRRTYCGEFADDSIHFTTWEALRADLRRLGVTHVIAPRFLATGGPAPPLDRGSVSRINREGKNVLVRRLLEGHGRLLAAAGDQGLYALDPAAATAR